MISFPSSASTMSGFVYAVDRLHDLSGETESVYPMDTPLPMPLKKPGICQGEGIICVQS